MPEACALRGDSVPSEAPAREVLPVAAPRPFRMLRELARVRVVESRALATAPFARGPTPRAGCPLARRGSGSFLALPELRRRRSGGLEPAIGSFESTVRIRE